MFFMFSPFTTLMERALMMRKRAAEINLLSTLRILGYAKAPLNVKYA
jgi:hypothetical protein